MNSVNKLFEKSDERENQLKRSPKLDVKNKKQVEMIHALVVVVKNIKDAVAIKYL